MEKRGIFLLVVFGAILIIPFSSALFIGITDGYVKNMTDDFVEGASVTVTVSGCSGGAANGCTGSDTTDSNGYYIVNNLNLPKSGSVSVTATKDSGSGTNTGTADDTQVAHVNVTICYAPSSPSLSAVSDSHITTVVFSWTSGTDPKGFSIFDEFDLNGTVVSPAASPITRVGMSFDSYTWQARTCNSACCSSWASDSFSLTNSAPSAPTNLDVSVGASTTSLSWTSGIDPEGDATYDEFRYDSNNSIVSPATSPYDVENEVLIEWSVRTCDTYGECSSWVSNQSINCLNYTCADCPVCEVCEEGTGTGGGGGSTGSGAYLRPRYKEAEIYCNGIAIENQTLLKIELFMGEKNKISLYGVNWSLEELDRCPWCYDGEKNYDERGVDCGGSCRPCTEAEIPVKTMDYLIWIGIALLLVGIGYYMHKKGVFKKIFEKFKYRGVY